MSETEQATQVAEKSPEQAAAEAAVAAREARRSELAAKVRQQDALQRRVKELTARRAELDEQPKLFQAEFERRRRALVSELNEARAEAQAANSAREELVRHFVPEELRRRRGQLEGAANAAKAACRPIAEDVQALRVQLEGHRKKGGDAHGAQRLESRLAAREVDLAEAEKKAEAAALELGRAEAEFQAAVSAALA